MGDSPLSRVGQFRRGGWDGSRDRSQPNEQMDGEKYLFRQQVVCEWPMAAAAASLLLGVIKITQAPTTQALTTNAALESRLA